MSAAPSRIGSNEKARLRPTEMKVRYKEDPRAWSKSVWFSALGLALLSSLLCWRGILGARVWMCGLLLLCSVAVAAGLRPAWFRGYYRFSTWSGFWTSQGVARALLALIFGLLIVPSAVVLRLLGKDPLRLRRPSVESYWSPARNGGSLDRLF